MATALSDGNLIVPVIKNADQLNLVGMAKTVNDLALRARNNNLNPDVNKSVDDKFFSDDNEEPKCGYLRPLMIVVINNESKI